MRAPARGPRASVSRHKVKGVREEQSHNLFDAVPLEAARAALLLHLARRAVAHPPAVGVPSGGRQLHVLLVDP